MRSTLACASLAMALLATAACGGAGGERDNGEAAPTQVAADAPAASASAGANGANASDAAGGAPATAATAGDAPVAAALGKADAEAAVAALGVPLFPGATMVSSIVGDDAGQRGAMVTLETSATPAEVASFYRDRLGRAGFAIKAQANVGDVRLLGGEKGNRSLAIQVSQKQGGGSTVALVSGTR